MTCISFSYCKGYSYKGYGNAKDTDKVSNRNGTIYNNKERKRVMAIRIITGIVAIIMLVVNILLAIIRFDVTGHVFIAFICGCWLGGMFAVMREERNYYEEIDK